MVSIPKFRWADFGAYLLCYFNLYFQAVVKSFNVSSAFVFVSSFQELLREHCFPTQIQVWKTVLQTHYSLL